MVSRSHIMIYDSMIIHSFLAFSQHVRYFSHVLLVCSLHLFLSQLSFDAPTLLVARQKLWHDSRDRDSKIKCSRVWFYTYCCQLVWHSIAAVRGVIHSCLTRIASLKWVVFREICQVAVNILTSLVCRWSHGEKVLKVLCMQKLLSCRSALLVLWVLAISKDLTHTVLCLVQLWYSGCESIRKRQNEKLTSNMPNMISFVKRFSCQLSFWCFRLSQSLSCYLVSLRAASSWCRVGLSKRHLLNISVRKMSETKNNRWTKLHVHSSRMFKTYCWFVGRFWSISKHAWKTPWASHDG